MTFMTVAKSQQQEHRPRFVRILRRIGLGMLALVLACILFFIGFYAIFGMESYFEPDPAIDTKFPPGYTEEGFNQIQIGDSHERVRELIGDPLERCSHGKSSTTFWCYSDDNASSFWDFAWLYRAVYFDREGHVTELVRDIYYD